MLNVTTQNQESSKFLLVFLRDLCWGPNCSLFISMICRILATLKSHYLLMTLASSHHHIISNKLNAAIKKVKKFFTKWKIRLNDKKTEAIIFTKRRPIIDSKIFVDNIEINWTNKVKYLGVTLDSKLNFTNHVNNVIDKSTGILVNLYPLISKKSKVNSKNKVLIYKTMVRPVLAYACSSWSSTCMTNYKKLQVSQNRFLRMAGNYNMYTPISQMHADLEINYIFDFIISKTRDFFERPSVLKHDLLIDLNHVNIKYKHKRIKFNL